MTDLGKTPWVDRTANAVWSRIVAAAPKPAWVPKHTTKRGGKVSVEEYGCGHYGCVMPTDDPEVVCKITSDVTEAVFVAAALQLDAPSDMPEGIVRYHAVYELPNEHRGRKTFVLWREAANFAGIGEMPAEQRAQMSKYDWDATRGLEKRLSMFKLFAAQVRLASAQQGFFENLAEAKRFGNWAWDRGAEFEVDRYASPQQLFDRVLGPLRGAQRLAMALRMCDLIAEVMENSPGNDLVGNALRYYLEKGLLLADVHAGNVGQVERVTSFLGWVITDPGHAVPLEERWRTVTVRDLP